MQHIVYSSLTRLLAGSSTHCHVHHDHIPQHYFLPTATQCRRLGRDKSAASAIPSMNKTGKCPAQSPSSTIALTTQTLASLPVLPYHNTVLQVIHKFRVRNTANSSPLLLRREDLETPWRDPALDYLTTLNCSTTRFLHFQKQTIHASKSHGRLRTI